MSRRRQVQWDNVVAKHAVAWEDGEGDLAVLLVPRFRSGFLARWLQPRLKSPHMRVKLDRVGSFAWRLIDGMRPFRDILAQMRTSLGADIDPAEERLTKFLSMLHKDRFVELFVPDDAAV